MTERLSMSGCDPRGTSVAAWITSRGFSSLPTGHTGTMTTPPSPPPNDIQQSLTTAEAELIERVEEACALEPEAPGAEDTGELLRLEEALKAAASAAERAVELRRLRRARADDDISCGVVEFDDAAGRRWRLWAVAPLRREGRRSSLEQLRPEYQDGWLTFETIDESERRRLPGYPADWASSDVDQLRMLLEQAVPVSPRKRGRKP